VGILIENAVLVQFHPAKVVRGSDLYIEGSRIEKVGPGLKAELQKDGSDHGNNRGINRVIDASGKLLTPGLICSHNHFYSALARGIVADIPASYDFVGVLQNLWWRLDRALDRDSLFASAMVGALDALRSGSTTVIDHSASPSYIKGSLGTLKEAFEQCGLRGILCYEVTDRNGKEGRDDGVEENREFIGRHESDTVKGAVGAHAPFTLSDGTLALLSELVSDTGRGIHVHVSEDRYEPSFSHHHFHESPLERMERFGMLDGNSLIIHGVHLLDKELDLLGKHDSFLIHNPRSNMNNAVGYNSKLLDYKNLAIGTDGIGSDMFEEAKIACFRAREQRRDIWPERVLNMLYRGNTVLERYFGTPFGRLEPGCAADLLLLDYNPPTPLHEDNVAGHFIFGLSSRNVHTVMVNGRVVVDGGSFTFDTDAIYGEARKQAEKLWSRMNEISP
jgi:putative selenium metabolism protein SsnA